MKLVFLYGMPAVGKLTVARELSSLTGLPLFHNHLAVDAALALFDFGTKPFVELRESIWLSSFQHAVEEQLPGLIFTFAFDRTVGPNFIDRTLKIVGDGRGEVIFVELKCSEAELERRLTDPSRNAFGKLSSLSLFHELRSSGAFAGPAMPPPSLSVEISERSAVETARLIAQELGLEVKKEQVSSDMPAQTAYDEWAASYDADLNRTRDLDALVMKQLLSERRFSTVVELGCGTGKNTALLAPLTQNLIGLDFSEAMLAQARKKLEAWAVRNVTLHVTDITKTWPVADRIADLIVCNLVLEHVRDISVVFREVSRCLAFEGQFLMCELHPSRQHQGIQARFNRLGQQFKIEAFKHDISEFLLAGEENGLTMERLQEWWHDDDKDKSPRLLSLLFSRKE
ncbi:MAG TPA: methyltransferase domain-containing protein [Pyrinomonadaceae bacterium]|nr:methyltransferase domain-containing protein [Pyrinomonadaceae bacterium]